MQHLAGTHVLKYVLSVEYVLDIVAGVMDTLTHRTLPTPLCVSDWWPPSIDFSEGEVV